MVGSSLLHYRIIKLLGKGGMGEVYLAHDMKLDRDVALKTLPPALRRDSERLRRFRTEARAAAKLSHPNIAPIFALEEEGDLLFITMEYVEGEPLYMRLPPDGMALVDGGPGGQTHGASIGQTHGSGGGQTHGSAPTTFFDIFLPLADALCHAHDRGVTHRDLKPGNVMITPEGVPRILDFGLAQISRPDPISSPAVVDPDAPTKSIGALPSLTMDGAIMGTPAYMSPEQASGQPVDARTDIFSFAVMQYEALTGRRPFTGDSQTELLARIIAVEPEPVVAKKPDMPFLLNRLIANSMQKRLDRRIQSMIDVRRELRDVQQAVESGTVFPGADTSVPSPPSSVLSLRRIYAVAALIILAAVIGAGAAWFMKPQAETPRLRTFTLPLDASVIPVDGPALSPDGTMVAFTKTLEGPLWIHDLSLGASRELPGTDGAQRPFWSPGSRYVGYFQDAVSGNATLRTVPATGGPATPVCELPEGTFPRGGAWTPAGRILFGVSTGAGAPGEGALYTVSSGGGAPGVFLEPDSAKGETGFIYPHILPDGKTVVVSLTTTGSVGTLTAIDGDRRVELVRHPGAVLAFPVYSPSGHLVYQRGFSVSGNTSSLWAVPFDADRLETTGDPFLVADGPQMPSVSADGTLLYSVDAELAPPGRLAWVDRGGQGERRDRTAAGGHVLSGPVAGRRARSGDSHGTEQRGHLDARHGNGRRHTADVRSGQ